METLMYAINASLVLATPAQSLHLDICTVDKSRSLFQWRSIIFNRFFVNTRTVTKEITAQFKGMFEFSVEQFGYFPEYL